MIMLLSYRSVYEVNLPALAGHRRAVSVRCSEIHLKHLPTSHLQCINQCKCSTYVIGTPLGALCTAAGSESLWVLIDKDAKNEPPCILSLPNPVRGASSALPVLPTLCGLDPPPPSLDYGPSVEGNIVCWGRMLHRMGLRYELGSRSSLVRLCLRHRHRLFTAGPGCSCPTYLPRH